MHTHSIEDLRHEHVFLGEAHARNERKTWTVIAICAAMMVAEIVGGVWFGSVALVADGLHMSTHAGALFMDGAVLGDGWVGIILDVDTLVQLPHQPPQSAVGVSPATP